MEEMWCGPRRGFDENTYQKELVYDMKLMNLRLVKAVSSATWIYSLLFLLYLGSRLTLNADHVHLNDLFIDYVPFFTFLTTGICLLAINLVSLIIYLEIRRVCAGTRGSIHRNHTNGTFPIKSKGLGPKQNGDALYGILESVGISYLSMKVVIIWFFSLSIWVYITYLSLANPPSPPYWPISLIMFVISYVCMVIMIKEKDSRVASRPV
jgi:hypothetical protein